MARKSALFVASMTALSLPLLYTAAPASASTTTWVPTATRAFLLNNATSLGALSASTPLRLVVALKLRNEAALKQYIQNISTKGNALYGQKLTPAEFATNYAPTAAEVQAVTNYLQEQGFTNITVQPNNVMISADATAGQAESAFNTKLGQFTQNGQTVYTNISPAQVPQNLSGIVSSVLGLNSAAKMQLPIEKQTTKTSASTGVPQYLVSYNPQQFWKAYDVAKTPAATKTNIAIFAEGQLEAPDGKSGVITDLRDEEAANKLPQVNVNVVPTGIASTDTSGADEWDMDTQYSSGMADMQGGSTLYVYDATSLTDSDIALEINRFVSDDKAVAGSASFGECEYDAYLDGSMLADDEAFAEAAAQGQTVFASAGDTGGSCAAAPTNGVPMSGPPDVNYPAASPYVVAAGGTTLLTNSDGSYDQETAWAGGGGGTSALEVAPYWQSGVDPGSTAGKGIPDVAMDADPESGANVWVGGTPEGVGGTSLSSPLSLGVWARMEAVTGNKLGFAAPLLYKEYQTAGFHDITLGDTGPYPATPGWDFATGLGTFDVAQMADQLTNTKNYVGSTSTGPGTGSSSSGTVSTTPTYSGKPATYDVTVNDFTNNRLYNTNTQADQTAANVPSAAEPQIAADGFGRVYLPSELGVGSGTDLWHSANGGQTYHYDGVVNAASSSVPVTAGGGDTDVAVAPVKNANGDYNVYVSSLSLANVTVSTSTDGGKTYTNNFVSSNVPVDDREWVAASGPSTVYLSYHDIATDNIDVERSDQAGANGSWTIMGEAINPLSNSDVVAASNDNELGNIAASPDGKYLYQVFVGAVGPEENAEGYPMRGAYMAVSKDGGQTFTDYTINVAPEGTAYGSQFPQVFLDSAGNVYAVYSDNKNIYMSVSTDHGQTWHGPYQVNKTGAVPSASNPYATKAAWVSNPNLAGNSSANQKFAYSANSTPDTYANQELIPAYSNVSIEPWGVGGDPGKADIVWYGTNMTTGSDGSYATDTTDDHVHWAAFMAQSTNILQAIQDGTTPTFSQAPVTPVVHRAGVCEAGVSCTSNGEDNRDLFDDFGVTVNPTTGLAAVAYSTDQFDPNDSTYSADENSISHTAYAFQTVSSRNSLFQTIMTSAN